MTTGRPALPAPELALRPRPSILALTLVLSLSCSACGDSPASENEVTASGPPFDAVATPVENLDGPRPSSDDVDVDTASADDTASVDEDLFVGDAGSDDRPHDGRTPVVERVFADFEAAADCDELAVETAKGMLLVDGWFGSAQEEADAQLLARTQDLDCDPEELLVLAGAIIERDEPGLIARWDRLDDVLIRHAGDAATAMETHWVDHQAYASSVEQLEVAGLVVDKGVTVTIVHADQQDYCLLMEAEGVVTGYDARLGAVSGPAACDR